MLFSKRGKKIVQVLFTIIGTLVAISMIGFLFAPAI